MTATNVININVTQDDIDDAILQYVHRKHPQTKDLDILDWDELKNGNGVNIQFDADTCSKYDCGCNCQ